MRLLCRMLSLALPRMYRLSPGTLGVSGFGISIGFGDRMMDILEHSDTDSANNHMF